MAMVKPLTPPKARPPGQPGEALAPLDWIELLEEPRPVPTVEGVVYSTAPRYAVALDDCGYYLKGPAIEIVFSEAVGYELAAAIGLPVPMARLWWDSSRSELWFASQEISMRSGVVELMRRRDGATQEFLSRCIALDAWIANPDRNSGNALAQESLRAGEAARFLAIDFEKAQVLRGTSRFIVNTMNPRDFRPKGELGELCRGIPFPRAACDQIHSFSESQVAGIIERRLWDMNLPKYDNVEAVIQQLAQRAAGIEQVVKEVWYGTAE